MGAMCFIWNILNACGAFILNEWADDDDHKNGAEFCLYFFAPFSALWKIEWIKIVFCFWFHMECTQWTLIALDGDDIVEKK